MTTLVLFVFLYILISIAIGLYASLRVRSSTDYILAGRSLPVYITIATVFATWFGSEAVLGIPATFLDEGLAGVVSDPFGAGFCLIFVGVFFAARLYRMKLMTIGDFYRKKYGRVVELLVSVAICISYLGWVSAQVVALGMVINLVSNNVIPMELCMLIGIGAVIIYTIFGGMWSVVMTDFVQMIMIIIGLSVVAFLVADRVDGGAVAIIEHASMNNKFDFWPEFSLPAILTFIGAFVTMGLGSIPQQDVFQRVMSAKNEKTAVTGTVIGGVFYIVFCFIPIFITYGVIMLYPDILSSYSQEGIDTQRILPSFIINDTPMIVKVMFFGALLSAIMSTASGTLLAPSALFAENILKETFKLNDKGLLRASRYSVLVFGIIVYIYAYYSSMAGMTIFEMVEDAYLVTLCGAFVPLAFGVYWKKANNTGALLSIILGVGTWISLQILTYFVAEGTIIVPPQLAGLLMSIVGMIAGSLLSEKKAVQCNN
jgi:SSS family transporter